MSEEIQPEKTATLAPAQAQTGTARYIARVVAWTVATIGLVLVALVTALAIYSTTADFQRRMTTQLANVLEDATGGRVEVSHITLDVWHLAAEVDGLIIHGLEGPTDAPYLSAEKILVRIKVLSFLGHATGTESVSRIALDYLRVESPRAHILVDKDGKTNIPTPRKQNQSTEPIFDTLLNLKAQKVEVVQGLAVVNDRAIPFNLAAQDLNAELHYLAATDRYATTIDLNDLRTQINKQPEAKSKLHLQAEIGRDAADLKVLDFHTGDHSDLHVTAAIKQFNNPAWQTNVTGSVELKQLTLLADIDGFSLGSVDLNLDGHSCGFAPPAAPTKKPKLLDRLRGKKGTASTAATPIEPDCAAGYLVTGAFKLHAGAYRNIYVRFHEINGGGLLHITPRQFLLTNFVGGFPGGGSIKGEYRIEDWLDQAPPTTAKGKLLPGSPIGAGRAFVDATFNQLPLRTILDDSAPIDFGDLGFDTGATGPVKVTWGGPVPDVADTVQVEADFQMAPTGNHRATAISDVPVTGQLNAHYDGLTETIQVHRLNFNTPHSTLNAVGLLGVNVGDPLTVLNVDLQIHDLAEYDQLFRTIALTGNNRVGAAAVPMNLHGMANFHCVTRGPITRLDWKGHLDAENLEIRLGDILNDPPAQITTAIPPPASTDVHIDTVVADLEYNPAFVALASSTLTRGTAALHISGNFKPRPVVLNHVPDYIWDTGTSLDAQIQLANSNLTDLLTIAGQQNNIPVTGSVTLDAHVTGTFAKPNGSADIALANGVAYGEPYESVNVTGTALDERIEANKIAVRLHGMAVNAAGGYDLSNKHLHGHIQGDNLRLSKFALFQKQGISADGLLSAVADVNGTAEQPGLKANVKLVNVVWEGKPVGQATAEAHSIGSRVSYTVQSTLVGSQIAAAGQTDLTGNYQTEAKLTLTDFDIARPLTLFGSGTAAAKSNISGTIDVSGPAKTPTALTGKALFQSFELTSQGITLKAAEPLTIGLRNGLATLDQVHITGPDTDMRASGTAQLFGAINPKTKQSESASGKLNIDANGSISMALAHTFDPDLLASGKVLFAVNAGGVISKPALTGKVQFQNVNLAIEDIPNGLSNMNGTLVFNEDRLNVQSLVATTGGGQVKIGGFLTYRNGLYADLTATGDIVRIRLYGLSATANSSLRLQGTRQSSLLSGNILLTRFGVGASVDFTAFAAANGVSAPPDPASPSNKIQLDVHVTSSPQLDFQNSYAKLAGTVDLTLRGTIAEPTVLGRIQITDGSATFAGTKYQLQRGDVYFTNPVRIDPTIDLDATARVENYDVTVGLHGTTTNLRPTYRSEPPLSEPDIFALLALGRTQEESQIYQEQQSAAGTDPTTNALLSGALNATVSNRVSKLFGGAGTVKIDPSYVGTLGNSSARITVQQQLSRQLSVTYATNVNSSAQQLIQLQYDLSPTMSIVAARDESGVFSVVYKIRRAYR